MTYESIDVLQNVLAGEVFHYTKDAKKAAGRALGTLVEIITFYLIKSWGFEKNTAIERRLPEYANPEITHNVEFSLHPSYNLASFKMLKSDVPLTSKKIGKNCSGIELNTKKMRSNQLLTSGELLRNSCTLCEEENRIIVAYLGKESEAAYAVSVHELTLHPFAVIECKRVGVEDGIKKGPQTIEKAKQGAYVARTVSSLQKIRMADGSIYGILHHENGTLLHEPYQAFLHKIIDSNDASFLRDFTLTVGVVSNHGNWFTSENHNKELKVLAQSYDWLMFLTDAGLSAFVENLLLKPRKEFLPVKNAFIESYRGKKGKNRFTKVKMDLSADIALQNYFSDNLSDIESWFNVITPENRSVNELKEELDLLSSKNWKDILT